MASATTEIVEQKAGGLPQLNVIQDGSYTNQIAWLVLTFILLYIVVSRLIVPRVTTVMEEREEKIAGELDTADRLRREAEDVRQAYEQSIAEARMKAQITLADAKEEMVAYIAKTQAELDAKLAADAATAEKAILTAKNEALAGLEAIATEVAVDVVGRLSGTDAMAADVSKAVSAALSGKGA